MKKLAISAALLLTFVLIFVSGCAPKPAPPVTPTPAPATPTPAPPKVYKLIFQNAYGPTRGYGGKPATEVDPKYWHSVGFKELVEKRTNGRVKIELHWSHELLPIKEALTGTKKRIVDIYMIGWYWGKLHPVGDVMFLPFYTLGAKHAYHLWNETIVGKYYSDMIRELGLVPLPLQYYAGAEGWYGNAAVRSLEDFKGLKVRQATKLWNTLFEATGQKPVFMTGAEIYSALQYGTIDLSLYPLHCLWLYKHYEVSKYMMVPPILDPVIAVPFMNKEAWEELPKELQDIILDVCVECNKKAAELSDRLADITIQCCKDHDIEIIPFSQEDWEKIQKIARDVTWAEFAARDPRCAELVNLIKEDQERWKKEHPEEYQEWLTRWFGK